MNLSHRAVLSFNSNLGKIVQFRIPRARLDNTTEEARASMQAMIDGGAIITQSGIPTSIRGAVIVSTTRRRVIG